MMALDPTGYTFEVGFSWVIDGCTYHVGGNLTFWVENDILVDITFSNIAVTVDCRPNLYWYARTTAEITNGAVSGVCFETDDPEINTTLNSDEFSKAFINYLNDNRP